MVGRDSLQQWQALINQRMSNYCLRNLSWITSLVLASLLNTGCDDGSGAPIHFIVPDGFVGKIQIIYDAVGGVTLGRQRETFICVVPTNGQLRVKSLKPFQSWHSETASYVSGQPLLPGTGTNSVSFFGLGSYASGNTQAVVYFVGTKSDADRLKY